MAKGVQGSGHTNYWLSQQRKETMASKYTGSAPKPKAGGTMKGKGAKKGCY